MWLKDGPCGGTSTVEIRADVGKGQYAERSGQASHPPCLSRDGAAFNEDREGDGPITRDGSPSAPGMLKGRSSERGLCSRDVGRRSVAAGLVPYRGRSCFRLSYCRTYQMCGDPLLRGGGRR